MSSPFADAVAEPDDALRYLGLWFDGVDPKALVSLTMLSSTSQSTQIIVRPLEDIMGAIEGDGLDPLIWPGHGGPFDLYSGLSTLTEPPGAGRRGGLKLVDLVPGVWIDLDSKKGAFGGEEEIEELLSKLPLRPTITVSTGAGGMHAYWKFASPVNKDKARELVTRWYLLAQRSAGDVKIDRLINPDRILRLPGSIRWPKQTDPEGTSATVCRIKAVTGELHDPISMIDMTREIWTGYQEQLTETRSRVATGTRQAMSELTMEDLGTEMGKWATMALVSNIDDRFAELFTWDAILEKHGWTNLGADDQGRVGWSRPGDGIKRGATTDWPESPNIMSLFTTAPETGLLGLHEAGIALTKWRVWVELDCGGDEKLAVKTMLEHFKRGTTT